VSFLSRITAMAGLKHLKPSNSYYEVIVPFVAYVTKSFEPSNSYYKRLG